MAANKTQPTNADVAGFLGSIEHKIRSADALILDQIFRNVTGFQPKMWGPTIVGYGQYHYTYESGREGDILATGFSPRKANMVVYISPDYSEFGPSLKDLGKHRRSKSCLYLGPLKNVDLDLLTRLISADLADLKTRRVVKPC